jgi:hypothetical protein
MTTPTTFKELAMGFGQIINAIIGLIFALAFMYVVWKIIDTWVIHADDEKKREEGRQTAIVAVIVLAVMVMTWGIVILVKNSLFGV